ncbi:MAG: class I SAM-dependent methyltransferase [Anaerolineaceae bacterium]
MLDREDSEYFKRYVETRNLTDRIQTYWRVDQGDAQQLKQIVRTEFGDSLDLVVDDASHQYELTKSSFSTLFPMLRPGGLYIIEDWAWAHWPGWQASDHPWAHNVELTRLIFDIVEAIGTSPEMIHSLLVFQGFAVIERGPAVVDPGTVICLEDQILRRPQWAALDQQNNQPGDQKKDQRAKGIFSRLIRK